LLGYFMWHQTTYIALCQILGYSHAKPSKPHFRCPEMGVLQWQNSQLRDETSTLSRTEPERRQEQSRNNMERTTCARQCTDVHRCAPMCTVCRQQKCWNPGGRSVYKHETEHETWHSHCWDEIQST
jgi:hypothetical protein